MVPVLISRDLHFGGSRGSNTATGASEGALVWLEGDEGSTSVFTLQWWRTSREEGLCISGSLALWLAENVNKISQDCSPEYLQRKTHIGVLNLWSLEWHGDCVLQGRLMFTKKKAIRCSQSNLCQTSVKMSNQICNSNITNHIKSDLIHTCTTFVSITREKS